MVYPSISLIFLMPYDRTIQPYLATKFSILLLLYLTSCLESLTLLSGCTPLWTFLLSSCVCSIIEYFPRKIGRILGRDTVAILWIRACLYRERQPVNSQQVTLANSGQRLKKKVSRFQEHFVSLLQQSVMIRECFNPLVPKLFHDLPSK